MFFTTIMGLEAPSMDREGKQRPYSLNKYSQA
jgi:hypothetical protein